MHIKICGRILSTLEPLLYGVALSKRWLMQGTRRHRGWHTILHVFLSCRFYRQPVRNPHRKRLRLLALPQWCHMQFEVLARVCVHMQHRIHRSVNNSYLHCDQKLKLLFLQFWGNVRCYNYAKIISMFIECNKICRFAIRNSAYQRLPRISVKINV